MSDEKKFPPALDLARLTENQRCHVIADTAATHPGQKVGFIVNNEEKVIERYIRKIKERNPLVQIERIGEFTAGGYALKAVFKPSNN